MQACTAFATQAFGTISSSRCQTTCQHAANRMQTKRISWTMTMVAHSRTLSLPRHPAGGARRDRTDDLLLAKQALSQLSYGPVFASQNDHRITIAVCAK